MCDKPWWDWDGEKEEWGWSRDPPVSQKTGGGTGAKAARKKVGGWPGRAGGSEDSAEARCPLDCQPRFSAAQGAAFDRAGVSHTPP